eukprot:COSAG05_NODE_1147_length_5730_cov_3.054520_4_plen_37_part_00
MGDESLDMSAAWTYVKRQSNGEEGYVPTSFLSGAAA